MVEWLKLANPDDSGQHDPNQDTATLSSVPPVSVQNKPAPGHKGPKGMAPRTAYTRVNTGTPPTPDAGSESQKSVAPRGLEFLPDRAKTAAFQEKDSMTMMKRPQLQDLVKEAMEGAARKVDINYEAARQLANLGEPERIKTAAPELSVTSGEYIEKLAVALDYLAKQAAEDSANVGPGVGPGALEASAARSSGQVLEAGKSGQGTQQPPKDPPMQSSGVAKDAPTGLQDNMEMMHGEQPVDPMHNEKTSSVLLQRNLERLGLTKMALSRTPEGHALDARMQRHAELQALEALAKGQEEGVVPYNTPEGGTGREKGMSILKALSTPIGSAVIDDPRHLAYQAAAHEAGRNPWNPWGGAFTPHPAEVAGTGMYQGRITPESIAAYKASLEGGKTASILERNLAHLGLLKKAADDGEGGAPSISAGSAPAQGAEAPPGASPSGEQVPSEPSDVNAQKALISSNEAAINYTKQQAKADPKRDAGHVYDEPALSAAHDNVLQQAFDATPKAGVKISHDLTRVAAAQALLRKYAEEAKEKKEDEKKGKEKESQLPGLSTPSGQSGFSASNQGM